MNKFLIQGVLHLIDDKKIFQRYDSSGMTDILATAGEDSTVKIWQTGNGQRLKSFKGNSGHVVIGVDVYKDLAAAASSDKTCRVWNIRTERMVRMALVMSPIKHFSSTYKHFAIDSSACRTFS